MARLANGAETSISMAFLVMCAEKIRKLLRLLFVIIFAWFYAWQRPVSLLKAIKNMWLLEAVESLVTA